MAEPDAPGAPRGGRGDRRPSIQPVRIVPPALDDLAIHDGARPEPARRDGADGAHHDRAFVDAFPAGPAPRLTARADAPAPDAAAADAQRDNAAILLLARIAAASAGQMRSENFPVALRLLPRRPRAHLTRVYRFARFVDDVGDEAPGDRIALLDLIDREIRALWGGSPRLAPVRDLRPVIDDCGVPIAPLLDLVEANRVDQSTHRYETFEDLLDYCRLSAAPIGQVILRVAGAATAQNIVDSDAVCSALQVLEHCQDVGEDARRGAHLPARGRPAPC